MSRGDGSVIAVEVAGDPGGRPVLFCHGLADSRLSVHLFGPAAREPGLRLLAPDRPGIGGTDPRRLRRLADWVEDAALVLDALAAGPTALVGVSAGGPFAAACTARLPGRVRSLTLICPLGPPGWPVRGMAPGQRLVLPVARHAPALGGWFLGRLAALARRSPGLFLRLATSGLSGIDRRALAQPGMREAFLTGYTEAFRRGSRGVAQDLRVLLRPWGFEPGSITVPAATSARASKPEHDPEQAHHSRTSDASVERLRPIRWPLIRRSVPRVRSVRRNPYSQVRVDRVSDAGAPGPVPSNQSVRKR